MTPEWNEIRLMRNLFYPKYDASSKNSSKRNTKYESLWLCLDASLLKDLAPPSHRCQSVNDDMPAPTGAEAALLKLRMIDALSFISIWGDIRAAPQFLMTSIEAQ